MIHEIKTALLGEEPRTDGGWTASGGDVTDTDATHDVPDPTETDPFRPAADSATDENGERLGMDHVFGILKNQRRRYVLTYLQRTEGTVTMGELAERIAAWECDKDIERITSQERKRVYVSLYQCHLPKMADASAISYDKERGKIEQGEQFDRFSRYLRRSE